METWYFFLFLGSPSHFLVVSISRTARQLLLSNFLHGGNARHASTRWIHASIHRHWLLKQVTNDCDIPRYFIRMQARVEALLQSVGSWRLSQDRWNFTWQGILDTFCTCSFFHTRTLSTVRTLRFDSERASTTSTTMKRVNGSAVLSRLAAEQAGTPSLTQLQDLMHVPPEHLFDPPRIPSPPRLTLVPSPRLSALESPTLREAAGLLSLLGVFLFLEFLPPPHLSYSRATASAPERVLDLRRLHGVGRFIFIPYDSFDWTWLVVTARAIYFRYYGTTFQLPWSRESLVSFAHIARPPPRAAATRRPRVKYVRSSLE